MKNIICYFSCCFLLFLSPLHSQWNSKTNGMGQWGVANTIKIAEDKTIAAFVRPTSGSPAISITTDLGENWIKKSIPETTDGTDIAIKDKNNIWFVTGTGKIYYTSDGGNTWKVQYEYKNSSLFFDKIQLFGEKNLIALGDAPAATEPFMVLKSSDGGNSWNQINFSYLIGEWSFDQFFRLSFPSLNVGYFYGSNSQKVYKTTDSGASWFEINTPMKGTYRMEFYDEKKGIFVFYNQGSQKNVYRTVDGGITWEELPLYLVSSHFDIEFLPGDFNKVWLTDYNNLYYSNNFGTSWLKVSFSVTKLAGRNIEFFNNEIGILLCDNSNLFVTINNGGIETSLSEKQSLPGDFYLSQNYPNPFNPATNISYSLSHKSNVKLVVYDLLGREIITLVNAEKSPGNYNITFDASSAAGGLTNGVYFYKLTTVQGTISKKMVFIK